MQSLWTPVSLPTFPITMAARPLVEYPEPLRDDVRGIVHNDPIVSVLRERRNNASWDDPEYHAICSACWDIMDKVNVTMDGIDWTIGGSRLHKRIGAALYKVGIKLQRGTLDGIADLAAASGSRSIVHYDVCDKLDWTAGDFGDDGSCIMSIGGCMEVARLYTLPALGVRALRIWRLEPGAAPYGIGRLLMIPAPGPDMDGAILLMNTYGAASTKTTLDTALGDYLRRAFPALVYHWESAPYSLKIDDHLLYTNSGSEIVAAPVAYAPGAVLEPGTYARVYSRAFDFEGRYTVERSTLAEPTARQPRRLVHCVDCGEEFDADDDDPEYRISEAGFIYCEDCYTSTFAYCPLCEQDVYASDMVPTTGGETICQGCADYRAIECEGCGSFAIQDGNAWNGIAADPIVSIVKHYADGSRETINLCSDCAASRAYTSCANCDALWIQEPGAVANVCPVHCPDCADPAVCPVCDTGADPEKRRNFAIDHDPALLANVPSPFDIRLWFTAPEPDGSRL